MSIARIASVAVVCVALLVLAAPVDAAVIAVNFGNYPLTAPSAFGVPLADWTQTGSAANGSTVINGVTVTWSSSNLWSIGGTPVTAEDQVYNGYMDDGSGGPTITLSGLAAWLPVDSTYKVTVLMGSGDNSENGFGEPNLLDAANTLLETFDVPGTVSYNGGTSLVGIGTSDRYALDYLTIDGKGRNEVGGQTRGSIAGIVVESVIPEPATIGLAFLGLGGLGTYIRRRRRKA